MVKQTYFRIVVHSVLLPHPHVELLKGKHIYHSFHKVFLDFAHSEYIEWLAYVNTSVKADQEFFQIH